MKPAATSRQARSTQDKTAEAAEQQVREVHKINDEAVLTSVVTSKAAICGRVKTGHVN
jgi:hypothetical protein